MSLMHPDPPHLRAVNAQLSCLRLLDNLMSSGHPSVQELKVAWARDTLIVSHATPFGWSREPIEAVLALAPQIPDDAQLNQWNLDTEAVWWWFEKPLPFQTLTRADVADIGVRALSMGWVTAQNRTPVFLISAWIDEPTGSPMGGKYLVSPTQVWSWAHGSTISQMLEFTERMHRHNYGPMGPFYGRPQVGLDVFIRSAEGMARFILAALMWLDAKVLVASEERLERHRRREFERKTSRPLDAVKVINLRRVEYDPHGAGESTGRKYDSCRWIVDGHARNQLVGPGRTERKLIWIHPFVKGDPSKPLRIPAGKVYRVAR